MIEVVERLTSVVIVTHQSATTIARCIDSVFSSFVDVQIVVVDNASADGTAGIVRKRLRTLPEGNPAVVGAMSRTVLIENPDNQGFARACNQGAAVANGDVVVFLNPDAFVGASVIGELSAHLRSNPEIGLLGCGVVDEAGHPHGPQRRRDPTCRRSAMTLSGLARFERRWPSLAGVEVRAGANEAAKEQALVDVDAVNGALMMLPRRALDAVGGFDEAFVLHAEDLDLCRRVRNAGWRVVHAAHVSIVHIGGVSSRQRPFWVEWQKTRSLWRYFRKHEPQRSALVRTTVFAGLGLLLVAKSPRLLASLWHRA